MDLLSLLGWILAAAFISISIMMGKNPETGKVVLIVKQFIGFIDPGSIMIVVGGTISSLMVSNLFFVVSISSFCSRIESAECSILSIACCASSFRS